MGRLCGGLAVAVFVICLSGSVRADISDSVANSIADDILNEANKPVKALNLMKVTDPLKIKEEPEVTNVESSNEIEARTLLGQVGKKFGSALIKLGKAINQETKKILSSFFNGIRKATKYAINKVASSTQKVWDKIKSKIPGDLKNKARNAGKKLMKKVLREVFEEASELALEYVQAMVVEYIQTNSGKEFCQCPAKKNSLKCRCCIKPPGFEKACMVIHSKPGTDPKLGRIEFSFRYNRTEFMKSKIAEDERGPCQKDTVDLSRRVCKNLPHYLHFLNMCFVPGALYKTEDKGGFVGCFQMTVDTLKLGLERCVLYTPPPPSARGDVKGETTLLTPEELEE